MYTSRDIQTMKKGLFPAISIGIAVLVIGSIAYAADRKKNTKTMNFLDDKIHEEEALKAELLKTVEPLEKKSDDGDILAKLAAIEEEDHRQSALLAEVEK
jgi:hypothetical protein